MSNMEEFEEQNETELLLEDDKQHQNTFQRAKDPLRELITEIVHPIRHICDTQKSVTCNRLENALVTVERNIRDELKERVCD